MKTIILTLILTSISFIGYSQEQKKIELAFMDYTESDSAFFNTEVPEQHYAQDNFDLYYHFAGDSIWLKVKKAKALKLALIENPTSKEEAKKYKNKKLIGKLIIVTGLTTGALVGALTSPAGGVAIIIASGGVGYYVINKSNKHLLKAIYLYNLSIKEL